MTDEHRPLGASLVLAFLVGAAAGAAVALLTAPKSGRQMRAALRDRVVGSEAGAAASRVVRAARRAFEEIAGDDSAAG